MSDNKPQFAYRKCVTIADLILVLQSLNQDSRLAYCSIGSERDGSDISFMNTLSATDIIVDLFDKSIVFGAMDIPGEDAELKKYGFCRLDTWAKDHNLLSVTDTEEAE